MTQDVKANAVIVTGASGGMGKACAINLWNVGYSIAVVDVNQEGAAATAKELVTSGPKSEQQKAWACAADVAKTSDVQALFADAARELGPLYGLVHAAGVLGKQQPAHEHDEDDWQRVISINLGGTIKMVNEAVRTFRKQGNPPPTGYSIVTIGSFNIAKPMLNIAIYSATKGAVKTFNQCVAKENARAGIRVNTLNPGGIRTPMVEHIIATRGPQIPFEVCPLERWGLPEEIANCAEFLISPKASFITGATYDVDGGRNA